MRLIPLIALLCPIVAARALAAGPRQPTTTDAPARLTICLVGDSTVTEKSGWGVGFKAALAADVACVNLAQGGRSSKSFRDEGHWQTALASKADYVLIQFGHNDQPGKGPARETDPATTFPANLKRYAAEARAAGMTPVIVTSLVRRKLGADGKIQSDLVAYADAAQRAAAEADLPLIDLHTLSIARCDALGEKGCEAISPRNETGNDIGGVDRTHLNAAGSEVFGRIVADELARVVPALARSIDGAGKPRAETSRAATAAVTVAQAAAATSTTSPVAVTIVLAGDSTVTDDAGWGAGFAALLGDDVELINLSRGGRSSRTFYDEGRWKQCLAAKPDYVLIQFGHNDEPGTERSTHLQTEFPLNIRRYVSEARSAGVRPVLVTPLVRRQFREDGQIRSSLAGHAQVVRDAAREMDVPLIELHDRSRVVCDALGRDACVSLLSTTKPNGDFDGTHLTPVGGMLMGAIVADELKRAVPELASHVRPVPRSSVRPTRAPTSLPAR